MFRVAVFGWEAWQTKILCQWHALRNLRKSVYGQSKASAHLRVTNELGDGDDEDLRKELMSNLSQMAKTINKGDCTMVEGVIRQLIERRAALDELADR